MSAVQETGAEFGIALGVAVVGTLANVIYRGYVNGNAPDGLSPGQLATAARDINGALDVAGSLPSALGTRVTALGQAAFVEGLGVAATASAVALAVLAVVGFVMLRAGSPAPAPSPSQETDRELIGV